MAVVEQLVRADATAHVVPELSPNLNRPEPQRSYGKNVCSVIDGRTYVPLHGQLDAVRAASS
jgi:hypothetical protein